MDPRVIAFIDGLRDIDDLETMRAAFSKTAGNYGFDSFAYLAVHISGGDQAEPLLVSTYPEGWTGHYMANDYFNFDPVVLRGCRSVIPFTWGTTDMTRHLRGNQKRLFDEAGEFGIRVGFTVPVHGHGGEFSGLTIASNDPDGEFLKRIDDVQHLLHLMAIHYHAHVSRVVRGPEFEAEEVELTARETECLTWAANGKTAWETSMILGISNNTVLFHIKNAKKKLGVYTINQAVVKSIVLGLIRP